MTTRTLRIALALQIAGLLIEGISIVHLRPSTFVLFAGAGVPLILLGSALYLGHVFKRLVRAGAL